MRHLGKRRRLLMAMAALLLAACAKVDGTTTAVLAERPLEYVIAGQGTPPVVFESGLGGRLDWWAKVIPDVAKDTRVFAYNRPGIGGSAPAATPRDGDQIVEELRATLKAAGLAPPYLLVGHSLGGLYMQLYARRHPREVAGLVLVDSTHPQQLNGAGARENWPAWARVAFDATTSEAAQRELDALPATGAELLALPPFRSGPVIVLSAARPMRETSPLAQDANAKRVDIARLNPGARQVWVDSGHAIPLEKPEAVIAAIRDVLTALGGGQTKPAGQTAAGTELPRQVN